MDRPGSLGVSAVDSFISAKSPPADAQFISNSLCSVLRYSSARTTPKALRQAVRIPDNQENIGCEGLIRPFLAKLSFPWSRQESTAVDELFP